MKGSDIDIRTTESTEKAMPIFSATMAIMAIDERFRLNPHQTKVIHQHHKAFVNYAGNCHVILYG
ncbi:hypothetical protein [Desulfocicer niacini]